MGTTVNTSAKVKKTKKVAKTTKTTTLPKYTQAGVSRLENGDVADRRKAFIMNLYFEYVFPGTISNESYFRYVSLKFTDEALDMLKDAEGKYNWDIITCKKDGSTGFAPGDFAINPLGDNQYVVEGKDKKCYFEVSGTDGAYKISKVSATPFK